MAATEAETAAVARWDCGRPPLPWAASTLELESSESESSATGPTGGTRGTGRRTGGGPTACGPRTGGGPPAGPAEPPASCRGRGQCRVRLPLRLRRSRSRVTGRRGRVVRAAGAASVRHRAASVRSSACTPFASAADWSSSRLLSAAKGPNIVRPAGASRAPARDSALLEPCYVTRADPGGVPAPCGPIPSTQPQYRILGKNANAICFARHKNPPSRLLHDGRSGTHTCADSDSIAGTLRNTRATSCTVHLSNDATTHALPRHVAQGPPRAAQAGASTKSRRSLARLLAGTSTGSAGWQPGSRRWICV